MATLQELELQTARVREQRPNTAELAHTLVELAAAYFGIDAAHSLKLSTEAYTIAVFCNNFKLQAQSLWQQSWVHATRNDLDQALAKAINAHTLACNLNDQELESRTAYVLSAVHSMLGNYPEALEHCLRALGLARVTKNRSLEADCLNMLGGHYAELNQYLKAVESCRLALEIYRDIDPIREVGHLSNLAELFGKLDAHRQAAQYAYEALKTARLRQTPWYEPAILHVLGVAHLHLQEFDRAELVLRRALASYHKQAANGQLLNEHEHLTLMVDIGKAQLRVTNIGLQRKFCGSVSAALQTWSQALDEATHAGAKPLQLQLHDLLYQLHKTTGRLAEALKHHEAWAALKQELFNVDTDKRIKTLQVLHDTREAQRQNEILRLKTIELESMVQSRTRALEETQIEMLERLAVAVEMRDAGTGDHIKRVGMLSAELAEHLGMDAETVEIIRIAAPLHDIGKIGIPDSILQKPDKLTPDEIAQMRQHTIAGASMLSQSTSQLIRMAETIALSHHERWDGTGYPQQLAGEEIPLPGRIVAVADAFDAITSTRPYKPALSKEVALRIIQKGAGHQFDPKVVQALVKLADSHTSVINRPA